VVSGEDQVGALDESALGESGLELPEDVIKVGDAAIVARAGERLGRSAVGRSPIRCIAWLGRRSTAEWLLWSLRTK